MEGPSLAPESHVRPALYGLIHALVDAATVTAVVRASHGSSLSELGSFWIVVGYDLLAFGLQLPLGLLADRLRRARLCMIVGTMLAAAVLAPLPLPILATLIVASLGNALFHLGAGALVLQSAGDRAAPAGLFVAPGALGLGLGLWMGRTGRGSTFPIYLALAFAVVALITLDRPGARVRKPPEPRHAASSPLPWLVILGLLLGSIFIRSFVGFGACFQCPSGLAVAIGLPLAACLGKLVGGFVADRLGWLRASVGALLLSLPLIAFSGGSLYLALPGVLLFQSTMAVTLVAVYSLIPRWPATAFGLPSLALVCGSLPTFYPEGRHLFGRATFAVCIAVSAGALALALHKLALLIEIRTEPARREEARPRRTTREDTRRI
jgi:MFS transporter, FSR family, fosmidomycin resistance protein